jgi:hypothetical protein
VYVASTQTEQRGSPTRHSASLADGVAHSLADVSRERIIDVDLDPCGTPIPIDINAYTHANQGIAGGVSHDLRRRYRISLAPGRSSSRQHGSGFYTGQPKG